MTLRHRELEDEDRPGARSRNCDERAADSTIAGLQTWVALPSEAEDAPPSFQHVPAEDVPSFELGDAHVRLLAGHFAGKHSPTRVSSPLYHCELRFDAGGLAVLDEEHRERGVLVLEGAVSVAGEPIAPRHLAVLEPGGVAEIRAAGPARVMTFGGARVGDRTIVWNFVGSTRERIDRAVAAWRGGDWPAVPGDDEIVPMP